MKKWGSICVALLSLKLLFSDLGLNRNFYDDYQIKTIDARALSLGRTTTLNSSPVFSLFDNPAMLSGAKSTEIGISSDWRKHKGEDKLNMKFASTYSLDAIAVVKPLKNNQIIIGVGYHELYEYDSKVNFTRDNSNTREKYIYDGNLGVYTAGIAFSNKSGIAIGLNINYGTADNENEGNIDYYTNNSFGCYGKYEEKISTTFINFGFKADGKYFCIGGSITPTHSINYDPTMDCESYTFPGVTLSAPDFYIDFPLTYSFGLNLKPEKNTTITFEYRNKNLKDVTFHVKKGSVNFPLYNYWGITVKNGHDLRAGVEYKFVLPIRIGYYYSAIPVFPFEPVQSFDADFYEKIPHLNPSYQRGITLGTELKLSKNFTLKVSYESSSFPYYTYNYNNELDSNIKISNSHRIDSVMMNLIFKNE